MQGNVSEAKVLSWRQPQAKTLARGGEPGANAASFHCHQESPMSRSRSQRIADFEARSVQLIAACTLGLAGMASAQVAPPSRQMGLLVPTSASQGLNWPAPPPTRPETRLH